MITLEWTVGFCERLSLSGVSQARWIDVSGLTLIQRLTLSCAPVLMALIVLPYPFYHSGVTNVNTYVTMVIGDFSYLNIAFACPDST